MAGKKKKRPLRRKPHIRQKEFRDRNISSIEHHARKGKTLIAPFMNMPSPVTLHSWKDQCIPNILWACVLTEHLPRERYLAHFRSVAIGAREHLSFEKSHITHNYLAKRTEGEFEIMFRQVMADPQALKCLSSLRVLDCLPDKHLWAKFFPEPDAKTAWSIIGHSIAACFDHQGEKATDIRWLKLMYLAIIGQVRFPKEMSKIVEELRLYPEKGDMRAVRPTIRSMEIGLRGIEDGAEKPKDVADSPSAAFWIECYKKTACIAERKIEIPQYNVEILFDELWTLSERVAHHFRRSSDDTAIDARLDGAFGLVLYALALGIDVVRANHHQLAGGRIIFRSIVELSITLRYLTKKDDRKLWRDFRNYGAGQAKLSFLKIIREQKVPDFIDPNVLEMLSNEDMWLEFQNMSVGSWSNSDLRTMATEASCKDIYDKYYSWSSAFTHGNWGALRDTVFATCMNPLHRLHRVPAPTRVMPSVLKDSCAIINRMLQDLDRLYPSFKRRIRWHKTAETVVREARKDTATENSEAKQPSETSG